MTEVVTIPVTTPALPPEVLALPDDPEAEAAMLLSTTPDGAADGAAILLWLVDRAQRGSLAASQLRIDGVREDLKAELDKFLEQVDKAIRAAEKAKKDDGGFFGDLIGSITKLVNKVLGPLVEHGIELVKVQVDVVYAAAKSIVTGQNLMDNVANATLQLVREGDISEDVQGFTEGAARFVANFTEYLGAVTTAVARGASGEDLGELLKEDTMKFIERTEQNILANPHFWAVVKATSTAVAVAASGGTLGPVALIGLSLMATLALDEETRFLDKFGDAAPWMRLGLGVAASLCLTFSGKIDNQLLNTLKTATGLLEATNGAYTAYATIRDAERRADAIDRQADQLQILNNMATLQRLLDFLLGELKEKSESHTRTNELGAEVVQEQAKVEAALIVPA